MPDDINAPGLERLNRLAEKALGRVEDPSTPPKWTAVSKICMGVGPIGVIGGIGAFIVQEQLMLGDAAQMVGLALLVVGGSCLAKVFYDRMKPSPGDRKTPERAMEVYIGCLRFTWWQGAAACLSWSAKDGTPVKRDEIAALDLDAVTIAVTSPTDLLAFWAPLIAEGRNMSAAVLKADRFGSDRALISAAITVELDLKRAGLGSRARQGGTLIRNKNVVRIVGKWAAYQRDGLWYLLEAGFPEKAQIARIA